MVFSKRRKRTEFDDYYDDDADFAAPPDRNKRIQGRLWLHLLVLALIGVIFLGAIWLVAGRAMLEKTMQAMLAPIGIVWIGLFLSFYVGVLSRARATSVISLALWLILSVAGNSVVSRQMIGMLERDYKEQTVESFPKFDVVLLLGGGVGTSPTKQPQLGISGDRLVQVAKLYHLGKIDEIVCSGSHGLAPYPGELAQAEGAYQLLTQMDVPAEVIVKINGTNTLTEMQEFDRWLAEKPNRSELKLGIATSAWHLRRALRLADSVGVDASPVATDFLSKPFKREPGIIVPTAENLMNTQRAIKELIAGWFGR